MIVLHDLVLHHLIAWMTINHGDRAGYIQAMREVYGEPARSSPSATSRAWKS